MHRVNYCYKVRLVSGVAVNGSDYYDLNHLNDIFSYTRRR